MAQRYGVHPVAYAHSRTPGDFFRDVQGWMATWTLPVSMLLPRNTAAGPGGQIAASEGRGGMAIVSDAATGKQVQISEGMLAALRRQGISKIYHLDSAAKDNAAWRRLARASKKSMGES